MTIKNSNTSKLSSQLSSEIIHFPLDKSFLSQIFESLNRQTSIIDSFGSLIGNSDFIDSRIRLGLSQTIVLWVDEQNRILDLIYKRL